jgi:hypothetical protein
LVSNIANAEKVSPLGKNKKEFDRNGTRSGAFVADTMYIALR